MPEQNSHVYQDRLGTSDCFHSRSLLTNFLWSIKNRLTSDMSKTPVGGSYGYQHGMALEFKSNVSLFMFIKPKAEEQKKGFHLSSVCAAKVWRSST